MSCQISLPLCTNRYREYRSLCRERVTALQWIPIWPRGLWLFYCLYTNHFSVSGTRRMMLSGCLSLTHFDDMEEPVSQQITRLS